MAGKMYVFTICLRIYVRRMTSYDHTISTVPVTKKYLHVIPCQNPVLWKYDDLSTQIVFCK